jgi:hypothetical protein
MNVPRWARTPQVDEVPILGCFSSMFVAARPTPRGPGQVEWPAWRRARPAVATSRQESHTGVSRVRANLWLCGHARHRHRVLCAAAIDPQAVARLLGERQPRCSMGRMPSFRSTCWTRKPVTSETLAPVSKQIWLISNTESGDAPATVYRRSSGSRPPSSHSSTRVRKMRRRQSLANHLHLAATKKG